MDLPGRMASWAFIAACLTTLLLATGVRLTPWFPTDDAYISFRYAVQLAEGKGLVFNEGERTEGYSNFLLVILLAGGHRLGISAPLAARWLSLLAIFCVQFALWRYRPRDGGSCADAAWGLSALILGCSFWTVTNVLTGLEAPLYAGLLFAMTCLLAERHHRASASVGLLLALSRPEGFAAAAGLFLLSLFWLRSDEQRAGRELARAWLLLFLLPFGAYNIWRISYFGSVVPTPILAKSGGHSEARVSWEYLGPFLENHCVIWVMAAAACIWGLGFREGDRARRGAVALHGAAVAGITLVALLTGRGDPYQPFARYFFPALPSALWLAAWAMDRCSRRRPSGRRVAVAGLLLFALQGAHVTRLRIPETTGDPIERRFGRLIEDDRHPHEVVGGFSMGLYGVASWLADEAGPDDLLATAEVGIVPYYSGVRVLDTFGLVTREVAELPGGPGRRTPVELVLGAEPDFVILKKRQECLCGGMPSDARLFRDPRFREEYELAANYPDGALRQTLVFARRAPSPGGTLCTRDLLGAQQRGLTQRRFRPLSSEEENRRIELARQALAAVPPGSVGPVAAEAVARIQERFGCMFQMAPVVRPVWSRDAIRVEVPEGAPVLAYRVGAARDSNASGERVAFEVSVRAAAADLAPRVQETIVAAEAGASREMELDLGDYAGEVVEIEFAVRRLDRGPGLRGVGWLDPRFLETTLE